MVTSIQLGNFFSSNGKTVLGGVGGSGLDTENLIKSLTDAKRLPATRLEEKISSNGKQSSALAEFKTLLSSLKDATNFLRNPPGVGNQAQNAFLYTTASVVTNTGVAASNYLTVATSPGVSPTTYNISDISSVARAKKQTTGSFAVASADVSVTASGYEPNKFRAGDITVNGETITLAEGDTLNQIAAKFNAVKADSGISASVVKAGTNDYRLAFTATETGTDANFDLNAIADPNGVFTMIGQTSLIANGTFDSGIGSWTDASTGTGLISYHASGGITIDGDGLGNEAFAQQAMTTVPGQQYTVRAKLLDVTSSVYMRIGTDADPASPNNFDLSNYEVTADGEVEFTFTATGATTYLTFDSSANTDPVLIDNVSVIATPAADAFTTTQAASDAVFTLDGVTITRQNNVINDIYDGVTFTLQQEAPALTTLAATVSADTSIVKSAVINFINAYNDLRVFAAKQSQVDDSGQYVEDAVLANSPVFRNTVSSITNTLTQIVSGITGGDPSRLAELGITFADLPESDENPLVRNIMDLNEGTLDSKLAENFDAFRRVFEFDLTSDNSNLRVFSRTNALSASNFTLNITMGTPPALPTVTATTSSGTVALDVTAITDNSTGTVIGYTLKGKTGTSLDGLQLIYSGTTTATINVTATQGLADQVFNITEGTLADTGALKSELDAMESADKRLQDQITRIDEQVERFRQQLLDKFAMLEQAISKVNNLLASIDAQNQTRYSQ